MIMIIDYGMGNLGSIANMLKKVGYKSVVSDNPKVLESCSKIILPGVGAFDAGMLNLEKRGWIEPLAQKVQVEKVPILGVCLGMQLMTISSEEGKLQGLSWINARTKRFRFADKTLKVPHMGWNRATISKSSSLVAPQEFEEHRYYFVHSFFVELEHKEDEILACSYGSTFTCGFEKSNILGVQFHPEKSHKFGMALYSNFASKY